MKPWKRIEPTTVQKVGFRTLVEKHFITASGRQVDRTTINQEGWAAACAVAITPDGMAIIARQFRPGPEKIFDELPGGLVDANETPEMCVVRELAEETGYKPGKVEYLGACYYDAYTNGDRHYFLLTDCVEAAGDFHLDDDEEVEVRLITIDELLAQAKRGYMTDPGGVLMAYDKLLKLKEETR